MIAERMLRVLVLLVAAGGCGEPSPDDPSPDATPDIMFEPFTSTTWSLSMTAGAAQLSITNGAGPAACALSEDHHRTLGAAGAQIILRLPDAVTDTCPTGNFTLVPRCATALGSELYVTSGCAFYRRWDAQGASLGITSAINANITIAGTATSCSIRANVGFLGGSFAETFALMNGTGAHPWCTAN